nr:mechanosensitive ion channel family protein [Kineosporia babensis]
MHRVIKSVADRIALSVSPERGTLQTIWKSIVRRPAFTEEAWSERRKQRARAIASLLSHLVTAALVVTGVLLLVQGTGLSKAGVFTAGMLGVIAAVSVQGLAKDIVAGLFVLVEDTYGIGDYVDTTFGAAGVVEEIGLRTTRLRGKDGTIWHVRHSQVPRLGNRTQAQTHLTLDITAGFPESPESALPPTAAGRLAAAERVVRMSLDRLDRDLASASGPNLINRGDVPGTLVEILPVLVPRAPRKALAALAAATSSADLVDTKPLDLAPGTLDDLERLSDLLEDAQVPVLTNTVLNGLINAGEDHVVLRVTGRVADTSAERALAVLRRRLYLDLNTAGFSTSFTVPGPADL